MALILFSVKELESFVPLDSKKMKKPIPVICAALLVLVILAALLCPFRSTDSNDKVYMPLLWNGVLRTNPKAYDEVEREYRTFQRSYPNDTISLSDFAAQMDIVQKTEGRRTKALETHFFKRDTESFILIVGLLVAGWAIILVSVVLTQKNGCTSASETRIPSAEETKNAKLSPKSLAVCLAMTLPALIAGKLMTVGFFIPAVEGFYRGAQREPDAIYSFLTQVFSCTAAGFVFVFIGTLTPRSIRWLSVWLYAALAVLGGWLVVADKSILGFFGQCIGAILAAILIWRKSPAQTT